MPGVTYEHLLSKDTKDTKAKNFTQKIMKLDETLASGKKRKYTFSETVEGLKKHVDEILSEIKGKRGEIDEFTIGKSYARQISHLKEFKYQDFDTWKLENGVPKRWQTYKEKGYHGLIVICAVTREYLPNREIKKTDLLDANIKGDDGNGLLDHKKYVHALQQQLLHHYAYSVQDPRLGNNSFEPGKEVTNSAKAFVLYLAFRLEQQAKEE